MENKFYKFQVNCDNCGVSELITYSWGIKRPVSIVCTNCGCIVDTQIANFNQNIKFTPPPPWRKEDNDPFSKQVFC